MFLAIGAAVVLGYNARVLGRHRAVLAALAEEFDGTYIPGGFLQPGSLRISYRGHTIERDTRTWINGGLGKMKQRGVLRLQLDPPLSVSMKVAGLGIAGPVFRAVGMKPLSTGDEAFDQVFRIRSEDASAKELLSDPVRAALLDGWRGRGGAIGFGFDEDGPSYLFRSHIVDRDTYIAFFDRLVAVADALRA